MRRQVKFLEIRDRATFIPAIAIEISLSGNSHDDYLPRRAGYGATRCIMLTRLDGDGSVVEIDPNKWGGRTWPVAHKWIVENWDKIADAEVIDVEYILGESGERKISERHD